MSDMRLSNTYAFFMLAFLFMAGMGSSHAANASGHNLRMRPLEITISKDAVLIGDKRVTLVEMQAELRKLSREPGIVDNRVYIKAGSALDYSEVMNVLEAVNKAGFNKIALVTDTTTKKD